MFFLFEQDILANTKWKAEFYNSQNLSGDKVEKFYETIAFDWGRGSPIDGLSADHFSARFYSNIAGNQDYFVQTYADDGIRVKVGDKQVINRWSGSAGAYNQALITNLGSGSQTVQVDYYENTGKAELFAEVVPLGDWYAYYYANKNLTGTPANARVVESQPGGRLSQDYGRGSPINGVPSDHFSAKYISAQRIEAGDYILRGYADDGLRIYIDDKLVLDGWKTGASQDDAVEISIRDRSNAKTGEKDIHWIRVEYYENTGLSKLDVSLQKKADLIPSDGWLGMYYNNRTLSGLSKIVDGGIGAKNPIKELKYDWGRGEPIKKISADQFSASFYRNIAGNQDYFVQTYADDGIRVKVGDKQVINRWSGSAGAYNQALITNLGSGSQTVQVDYYENTGKAELFAEVVPLGDWYAYYYANKNLTGTPANARVVESQPGGRLSQDYGRGSPISGVPSDQFSVKYISAQEFDSGEYVLRARADDGIRVYIDGKLVLDRWSNSAYREDAIRVNLANKNNPKSSNNKNIYWIEVHYYEDRNDSKVDVSLEPYNIESNISTENWYVEYFNNTNLHGSPVHFDGGSKSLNKISDINFDWGRTSPHSKVNSDNFSARFIKDFDVEAGEYILRSYADDGIRIYVDDQLVVDRWHEASEINKHDSIKLNLDKGKHRIKVEYLEKTGSARLRFSLNPLINELSQNEWLAIYYNNQNLTGKGLVDGGKNGPVTHNTISNNWGRSYPIQGISNDEFSASFFKTVEGQQDYFVTAFADDGVRVTVGDKVPINRWSGSAGRYDKGLVTGLPKGTYKAQVDYYDRINEATIFAEVVPLGNWYAYYYDNIDLTGHPVNSETIKSGSNGSLSQNHGYGSPISGVPNDYFSAKYISAQRITAGEYIVKTGADDGVRVYIDGELVLDRWNNTSYREDAVKINIKDNQSLGSRDKDIHWIEIEYYEHKNSARLDFSIEPYSSRNVLDTKSWYAEYYSNDNFSGIPYVQGFNSSSNKINQINFNWGSNKPHRSLTGNNFTARYQKKVNVTSNQKS